MSRPVFKISFGTILLLIGIVAGAATEQKAVAKAAGSSAAPVSTTANQKAAKPPLAAAKARLVDINSAGVNELKTLPGVTEAIAQTIIAGRPFGTKAQLTTRGILSRDTYEDIKTLVIAKQTVETTAKLLKK